MGGTHDHWHRHLADLGAWVIDIPTIEVRPLRIDAQVRDAINRLDQTGLVVFASVNAVEIFFDMLFELHRDARALRNSKLCAIGPETARRLDVPGLAPALGAGLPCSHGARGGVRRRGRRRQAGGRGGAGPVSPLRMMEEAGADRYAPHYGAMDPALVAELHGAGKAVGVWTVDDAAGVMWCRICKPDSVFTNRPREIGPLLKS